MNEPKHYRDIKKAEKADKAKVSSSLNIDVGDIYTDVGFRIARNASSMEKSVFAEKKKLSDKLPSYFATAFRNIHKQNVDVKKKNENT